MKMKLTVAGSLALLVSSVAFAQETETVPLTPPPEQAPPPPSQAPQAVPPPEAQQDAPPVANLPPPPVRPGALPPGQWVDTAQYGWVWMPYDRAYSYAPLDAGGDPYLYLYTPLYGWRWLAAPWVLGIGPRPYFGVYG